MLYIYIYIYIIYLFISFSHTIVFCFDLFSGIIEESEEEFSPPRMKSMMERPNDVEYIHDEYFGEGSCKVFVSFDELEKTVGSKWRKKKGEANSYEPREDKIFSRLNMLAHAVMKIKE